jgi:hypothetical protein
LVRELEKLATNKRYRIVEVNEGATADRQQSSLRDSAEHVDDLISLWQHQDGTPVARPAPNDGTMTPSEALFRKWASEDALLTADEAEAEARFWKELQSERESLAI